MRFDVNETELVALVEEILEVESGTVDLGDSLADIDCEMNRKFILLRTRI